MNRHIVQLGFATLLLLVLSASCCHKKEEEDFNQAVCNRIWFTTLEERWNTDYNNEYIDGSHRDWEYDFTPGSENWLWYFIANDTSYLIHTKDFDTIYYAFAYTYIRKNTFDVSFETTGDTIEEYHATIEQLDDNNFIFSHEYRWHSFERVTTENVTGNSKRGGAMKINPKNIQRKPSGPLIQVE